MPGGLLGPAQLAPGLPQPEDFAATLNDVRAAYPGLAPHLDHVIIQRGKTDDDRQLEYYRPEDSDNPNPGRSTVELYNPALQGPDLREAVALDMLHHVGGTDASGAPIDPTYYALKQRMADQVTLANRPMDREAYSQDAKAYPGTGSYEDWMQHNRADAYIRAYVNPAMNPEWTKPGTFTPAMRATGDAIVSYLKTPPKDAARGR